MPLPLAFHLTSPLRKSSRFLALALSLVRHDARAQLPAPARARSSSPAPAPAPVRHKSTSSAPALPAPAQGTSASPEAVPSSAAPESKAPASAEQNNDGVIIVPQDALEVPNTSAPAPQPAPAKPKIVARVGGVDVSSGTETAALNKLRAAHLNRLSQPIVLRLGAREWWTTRSELGASLPLSTLLRAARERARPNKPYDVALRYELNEAITQKYLQKIAPSVRREPQAIGDGATGRAGEELSIGGSLARIKAIVEGGGTQVELLPSVVDFIPRPQPKAAPRAVEGGPSSGDARFPILLGEYSTHYNARLEDRTENLRIAAREMNGTILQPGEVFSTNLAIGPRSTDRGFRAAHIFMGKKVIEGVGGGICQSATTVYNAALGARLPIVERHSHSLPVSYATPQNDATIYWGQLDMKFRNNTGAPILVRTFLKGGRFHAQILGARSAASVRP